MLLSLLGSEGRREGRSQPRERGPHYSQLGPQGYLLTRGWPGSGAVFMQNHSPGSDYPACPGAGNLRPWTWFRVGPDWYGSIREADLWAQVLLP